MTRRTDRSGKPGSILLFLCSLLLFSSASVQAAQRPEVKPIDIKVFAIPETYISNSFKSLEQLPPALSSQLRTDLGILGGQSGFYDVRAGRWGTLVLARPFVPGSGAGNALTWAQLGILPPANDEEFKAAVSQLLRSYLVSFSTQLGLDVGELSAANIAVHENRRLLQVNVPRVFGGIPVRESFVTAVINSGNLILFGTQNWGAISISPVPSVLEAAAVSAVESHLQPFRVSGYWRAGHLAILPTANGADLERVPVGQGYRYRLAWVVSPQIEGDSGSWEALVDAHTGEILYFADLNQYAEKRRVFGGIFPVSNDGLSPGGVPDGVEQPRHPMPFANIRLSGGQTLTTNSAGLVDADGRIETTLAGPFLRIGDTCGAIREARDCTDLDLGTSGGTDCTVPVRHSPGINSAGDTHSARSGFYEVNRIIEQAKGWISPASVPNNPGGWLNRQLLANMNIQDACNANFNLIDGTINFFRDSSRCRNTGEIAAVFDHEWGHGLDFNDNKPGITSPGEAYADIAAVVRLNTSCIGRGFLKLGNCPGDGDACLDCSGVRQLDWGNRLSGKPHTIGWVNESDNSIPGGCNPAGGSPAPPVLGAGPCGFGTHCEGTIVGEAFWDLITRDLPCNGIGWENVNGGRCVGGVPPAIDRNTALQMVTRLFYLIGGNIQFWYQCNRERGGCNADGGYLNLLAADDDNGTLADGTPHMKAIFDALNRHEIACTAIPVANRGCIATPAPTQAPTVTATATINGAQLSWNAVPNAVEYWVFRTEGVHGCNFGKQRIARTAGTTFSETGLLDGFRYFYSVIPVGGAGVVPSDSCGGPESACASVTPLPPAVAPRECPVVNDPPAANNDTVFAYRNTAKRIDVLANDSEPNFDPMTVTSVTDPPRGSTVLNGDNTVTYTPDPGSEGTDSFQYAVTDGLGGTSTATVTVTVIDPACAEPGFTLFTDPAGDSLSRVPEHDVLSLTISEPTALGGDRIVFTLKMASLRNPPPNTTWPVIYRTPDGRDRFVKMATNSTGVVSFAFGTGTGVTAAGVPADPSSSFSPDGTIRIVVPRSAIGNPQSGGQLTLFLTRIRVDVPGVVGVFQDNMPNNFQRAGSYDLYSCPACPVVTTGTFKDMLEPTAKPGWGVQTPRNAVPASATWQVVTDAGAKSPTHSFFSDATTLDVKDDRLLLPRMDLSSASRLIFWHRFQFESAFDGGVLEVSTDGGATWRDVLEGGGSFAEGGYNGTIAAGFGSPIAGRAAWTFGRLGAASPMSRVVANLGTFAGRGIRARLRLACDPLAAGSTPGVGWFVDDVEFTNTLVPSNCNLPPTAREDSATTSRNTPVTVNVLANDADPDGDRLTVTSVTQGANGSAVISGGGASATYSPNTGFVGSDSFTYTISDGNGNSSTATVRMTVVDTPNRAPDAVNDSAATQKNTPVTIPVLANDTDPDADALTVSSVTPPGNGSAVISGGGTSVTYTPNTGFVGTDSFNYTASDGRGGTDTATVAVTVSEPPNRPPDAVDDSAATTQNMAVTINVLANDGDPDGDPLTVSGVTQPSNGSAVNNGNGTVTYTPNRDFVGTDSFNYTISDGRGGSDTAAVRVTVNPAPAPAGTKATGGGWIPGSGNGRSNFSFNAQLQGGVAKGRIGYETGNGGISLRGSVASLRVTGSQADFTGPCTLASGASCSYAVHAEDNAEPGAGADRFRIQVFDAQGALIHQAEGLLGAGNIQVH